MVGPQHHFVKADEDLIFYGGSAGGGKSYGILIKALQFVDDPDFYCGFFRKTLKQLEMGLWKDALKMVRSLLVYPPKHPRAGQYKGKAKILSAKHTIRWPSGAEWIFGYLDNDQAVEYNYQGSQWSAIFIDEATHASAFQINYLRTRLRSDAKNKAFMCLTMNPDQDHYVYQFVQPFLDEDGYPKRELSGKKRYYIFNTEGIVKTSWSHAELKKDWPEENPREYTFIPSLLSDNPKLLESEPDYADNLKANSPAQVAALLRGCWHYRPNTGTHFQRNWCQMVKEMPRDANRARAWDLASSEPTAEYRNPDYTASIRMARAADGYFYVETGKRFRKRAGERDRLMMNLAQKDGDDVGVVIPRDSGAGGKAQAEDLTRKFVTSGFTCKQIPAGNAKGMKVKRFAPFSSAAENGLVRIVTSGWDTQEELEAFLGELESFTGDGKGHDDWVDSCADCFNHLSETRYIPSFTPWAATKVNEFKQ